MFDNSISTETAGALEALRGARVIVLNDYAWVNGGASKVALDEAEALAEAGLDVTLLAAVGPVAERLRGGRVKVVCLDQPELLDVARAPAAAIQAIWNGPARARLAALLAEGDPRTTIVHLHGYTKALSAAPLALARARGATTVCTLHDFFAACPNGAFFDYRRGAPCGERALGLGCLARACDKRSHAHKAYRVARQAAQRWVAGFPASIDAFVTLSDFSARQLAPYLPADRPRYALGNIIEAEPGPAVDVAANRQIVAVGRLDIEKGVRPLLAAAEAARLTVRFVGDGPLRAEVDAHPFAEATGWVDAARVREELRGARALVFPSLWYEAFGLVVDEAAALGVPAIVSDVSAAAERVAHGESGLIVPSGSDAAAVASLADALRKLGDPALAARLGAAAHRRFWAAPPTREAHAAALMQIYADLAHRRRTPSAARAVQESRA